MSQLTQILIVQPPGSELLKVDLKSIGYDVTVSFQHQLKEGHSDYFEYLFCPTSFISMDVAKNLVRNIPNIILYGSKEDLKQVDKLPAFNVGFNFINVEKIDKKLVMSHFLLLNEKNSLTSDPEKEVLLFKSTVFDSKYSDDLKTLARNTQNYIDKAPEAFAALNSSCETIFLMLKELKIFTDFKLELFESRSKYRVMLLGNDLGGKFEMIYEPFLQRLTESDFIDKRLSLVNFIKKDSDIEIDIEFHLKDPGYQTFCFMEQDIKIGESQDKVQSLDVVDIAIRDYFVDIIEWSAAGVAIIDIKSGKIKWQNKSFRKLLGLKKTNKNDIFKFIQEDKAKFLREIFSMVDVSGANFEGEIDFVKGNKKHIYCDLRVTKLDDMNICLELCDASNKAMLNLLTEEHEMFRSQQLEVIENAKISGLGTMIGGISHEINNPLAVICGRIDIAMHKLQSGRLDVDDLRHTFERLKEMTNRMTEIITHLRTFAFGFSQEAIAPISLKEIIDNSLFLLTNELTSKNISVELNNVSDDVFVQAGRSSLLQVFFNLIHNSIEAIERAEERWIKIEAKNSDQRAFIRIIDSGGGIPPHISEKMMDPFYSTKEIGDGSGLGLSVAKRSLAQYGGDLSFLGEKKNTTFQIELPCHLASRKSA